MVERRGDLDLAQKAIGAEHAGQFRAQDLHRHSSCVLQVAGEIDGRHSAAPELALDRVAIR